MDRDTSNATGCLVILFGLALIGATWAFLGFGAACLGVAAFCAFLIWASLH